MSRKKDSQGMNYSYLLAGAVVVVIGGALYYKMTQNDEQEQTKPRPKVTVVDKTPKRPITRPEETKEYSPIEVVDAVEPKTIQPEKSAPEKIEPEPEPQIAEDAKNVPADSGVADPVPPPAVEEKDVEQPAPEEDIPAAVEPPEEPAPPAPIRQWKTKGSVKIFIKNAIDLEGLDRGGTSDPYVSIYLNGKSTKQKTNIVKKNNNPIWNKEFVVPIPDARHDVITLKVSDHDMLSRNDHIGDVVIPISQLLNDTGMMGLSALPIQGSQGKLFASFQYIEARDATGAYRK